MYTGASSKPGNKALEAGWRRISAAFPALESAYFSRRQAALAAQEGMPTAARGGGSGSPLSRHPEFGLDAGLPSSLGGPALGSSEGDHLSAFSGDLSRFVRYNKLKVCCPLPGQIINQSEKVFAISPGL